MPAWSWGQQDLEALASHPHPPPHVQPQSSWMELGGLGWAPPERQALLCAVPPGTRSASDHEVLSARVLHLGRSRRVALPSIAAPSLQHGGLRGARGVSAHLALVSGHMALLSLGGALGAHQLVREDPLEEMANTPVFLPGESRGQRSLAGYSPWGCKELDYIKSLFSGFNAILYLKMP